MVFHCVLGQGPEYFNDILVSAHCLSELVSAYMMTQLYYVQMQFTFQSVQFMFIGTNCVQQLLSESKDILIDL